jgi:biopolymer transport protein ExbD
MAKSEKLRSAQSDTGDECKLDLSPMIDMVFLLLIFFLVNATMIVVKKDPKVIPAVASKSQPAEDGTGRIVINVREDGTFTDENGQTLLTEDDMRAWVRVQREKVDLKGKTPKLHLRGDRETTFSFARKAIRAAAAEGVNQVVFAVYLK